MIDNNKHTISLLVHEVAHQLRTTIDSKVGPFKLTRLKWVALSILKENPGISQMELAYHLEIDRSSAGRLLDRMDKSGLISRTKDSNDRRIVRVYIKEEAKPLLDKLHDVSDEIKLVTENGLSEVEQNDLVRLLRKVQENLKVGFGSFAYFLDLPEQAYLMLNFA